MRSHVRQCPEKLAAHFWFLRCHFDFCVLIFDISTNPVNRVKSISWHFGVRPNLRKSAQSADIVSFAAWRLCVRKNLISV
jgi:hypothetical protein